MHLVVFAALASAAVAQGDRSPREALLDQDRATAAAARRDGVARGLGAALAPDALILVEGAPILRRDDGVRFLEAQPELRSAHVEWLPLAVLLSDDGTLGVTYGVTTIGGGDGPLRFGKYVSVWRRQGAVWQLMAHVQTRLLEHPDTLMRAARAAPPAALGSGTAFAAADSAFARLAADSGAPAAFAAFAAPTGVTFPGTGEVLIGPAAIRARMMENRARTAWVWAPLFAGASNDGGLGYTVGEAAIMTTLNATATTFYSKYLTVWRRMPDGTIRFLADAGNLRPR